MTDMQDAINKMRNLDDKIIYALNASIPTDSFKVKTDPTATCKALFDQWLDYSPPTKSNQVRFPARSHLDFRTWESCRTMQLVGGFSWGSPVSPTIAFQYCSIFTLICFQDLVLKVSYDAREAAIKNCILLSTEQLKQLKVLKDQSTDDPKVIKAFKKEQTKQHWNAMAGEMGDPQENPLTSNIVWHDSCWEQPH
ncbi:hypothetical protein PR048_030946 [Dryococelus australis]|uniref:Protein MIX23 n=1 Tax=Dryococelus australis TaxID=614101 RepID=A0ABQ9GAC3_9NEOP|nr:hypothetical protein PR048_030946 [Dryococelus australis]